MGSQIKTYLGTAESRIFDKKATELGLSRYEFAQKLIMEGIIKDTPQSADDGVEDEKEGSQGENKDKGKREIEERDGSAWSLLT